MWCIDTVEYHATTEKNETLLAASQSEKDESHDVTPLWNLKYDMDELVCKIETNL